MSRPAKTLERLLRGTADANLAFRELRGLLKHLGFTERVKGSHYIFSKEGVLEILNLQPKKGGKAKAYQVRQVREVILQYGLASENEGEENDGKTAQSND